MFFVSILHWRWQYFGPHKTKTPESGEDQITFTAVTKVGKDDSDDRESRPKTGSVGCQNAQIDKIVIPDIRLHIA